MSLPGLPLRIKMVQGTPVSLDPEKCEPHTKSPGGYLQWHEWAERKAKTHEPRQCKGCGLWAIWEPLTTAKRQPED